MKKIGQIVLVLSLLLFTYHSVKIEETSPVLQETVKVDYTGKMNGKPKDETAGQTKSTLIGDVIILEKNLYATIEVEGWEQIKTWNLSYPFFDGDDTWILNQINDRIFELVRGEWMTDSVWVFSTEMTYEITYMDSRLVCVLFEGSASGSGYHGLSRGMIFDLKTGQLLSLDDFYDWAELKKIMRSAMDKDQLSVQIAGSDIWIEGDKKREYLEKYFVDPMHEEKDSRKYDTWFFIEDGYLCFITEPYPSVKEYTYVRWEVPLDMELWSL